MLFMIRWISLDCIRFDQENKHNKNGSCYGKEKESLPSSIGLNKASKLEHSKDSEQHLQYCRDKSKQPGGVYGVGRHSSN